MVGIAQLVRAPGCGPGGRGFDSHHSPSKKTLVEISAFYFFKGYDGEVSRVPAQRERRVVRSPQYGPKGCSSRAAKMKKPRLSGTQFSPSNPRYGPARCAA